jgi:hypothetical protein
MVEGHGRDAWARTALVCTIIANAHRDPKKGRAFRPEDFDPYAIESQQHSQTIEVTPDTIGQLKEAFAGQKGF